MESDAKSATVDQLQVAPVARAKDRNPLSPVVLGLDGGRVSTIHLIANPDKLGALDTLGAP